MKIYNVNVNYSNAPTVAGNPTKTNAKAYIPAFPVNNIMNVSEIDLVWGSIYANKEQRNLQNPKCRLDFDVSLVKYIFDLSQPNGSDLHINPDSLILEQTQKNFLMNRMGTILCNIAAKKYLGLKHLNHLQNVLINGGACFNPTTLQKFPDYFGQNNTDCFIIEAKGSSNPNNYKQKIDGISQLNAISSVQINKTPITPYKFLIQTTVKHLRPRIALIDPPGDGEKIEINNNSLNNYQLNFGNIERKTIQINEEEYSVVLSGEYAIGFVENHCDFVEDIIICNRNLDNVEKSKITGLGNDLSIITGKLFTDGTLILKMENR